MYYCDLLSGLQHNTTNINIMLFVILFGEISIMFEETLANGFPFSTILNSFRQGRLLKFDAETQIKFTVMPSISFV